MAKLWQFLQGHPKPAFSVKVERGDQAKFFKNRPKSSPRLKGPKAHWRKWHYPLIIMHLRAKTGDDFGANSGSKRARMAKLWQFSRGHSKGGAREILQNRPKSKPRL